MYSVGEELNKAQVAEVWANHSTDNKMSKQQYMDYMVTLAGDSDTKENVLEGFKLLNNYDEHCSRENLDRVMNEHDVAYIYKTIPAKPPGEDYEAWTEEIFSR
tara:strand:- start:207 stop:515 length:309 start_codon:yes stop_codon:yes gene_type:complete